MVSSGNVYYQINPDVVLREEEDEGALLFNPDTSDVKIINYTGLLIWKICEKQKTLGQITEALKQSFDQAPEDSVKQDAEEFISHMVASGFLGQLGPDE